MAKQKQIACGTDWEVRGGKKHLSPLHGDTLRSSRSVIHFLEPQQHTEEHFQAEVAVLVFLGVRMGIKVLSSLPSLQLQLQQKEANFLPRPQGVKKEMPADGLLRKISSGVLLPGWCLRQTAVTNKPPRPCPEPARPAPGRTKARAGPCCGVALRLPLQRSRAGERAKSPQKSPSLGKPRARCDLSSFPARTTKPPELEGAHGGR